MKLHSDPNDWPKSVCRSAALKVVDGAATRKERVLAKCGDCMGGFQDGLKDCEAGDWCPLYPDMPYGSAFRNREKKQVSQTTLSALKKARTQKKGASKTGSGSAKRAKMPKPRK